MTLPTAQRHLASPAHPAGTAAPQSPTTPNRPFDPVPGHPHVDVAAELRNHAQIPGMQDAVAAIFLLHEGKPVHAAIPDASCQMAAFLLMELGQGPLLCRLAQERPLNYALNIGAADQKSLLLTVEQKAEVLAYIGTSWPQGTPLTLILPTSQPAASLQALHALLQRPTTLDVRVIADGTQDAVAAEAFATAMQLRPLSSLFIECSLSTPEALQALSGVKAQSIGLQISQPPEEARRAEFEAALVTLVSGSGATRLAVADASVSAPLAALLLGCRDHWVQADLRLEKEVSLLLLTKKGQLRIDRLDVRALAAMLSPTAQTLRLLANTGVTTLAVHGALDLNALTKALQASASGPGGRLSDIEACCMVRDGADVEQILALLTSSAITTKVSHRPMPATAPDHRPLNDDEAARLAASASSNSSMALTVGSAQALQHASERAWWDAIEAVGWLLMPHKTVQELLDYLHSPQNKTISTAHARLPPPHPRDSTALVDKLSVLRWYGATDELVRKVVGEVLKTTPEEMVQVALRALFELQFPMRYREGPADWYGVGRTAGPDWMSDGMPSHVVRVSKIEEIQPQESTASAQTTTTTTTSATTTTTTTGTAPSVPVDSATALQPATEPTTDATHTADPITPSEADAKPKPLSLVELLEPSTEGRRAQLISAMRMRVNMALTNSDDATHMAAVEFVRLLEHRSLDMSVLPAESQAAFARLLLDERQWKLLRHFLPAARNPWQFHVRTAQVAQDLAAMAPWPAPQVGLKLILPTTLSEQAIQDAGALARTVAPEGLLLTLEAAANADATRWNALAALVLTCPKAMLVVQQSFEHHGGPAPAQSIAGFLAKLGPAQLGSLTLNGILEDDQTQLTALATAVQQSGVPELWIAGSSNKATQMLATCKPWKRLTFIATPDMAKALKHQTIHTEALSLLVFAPRARLDPVEASTLGTGMDRECVSDILSRCKRLQVLDLWGAYVDLGDLAHILVASGPIPTVMCAPSADTLHAAVEALALLRQNTSLRHFLPPSRRPHPGTGLAIEKTIHSKVLELTVRNRFLSAPYSDTDAEEFAIGAVRGLAWSYGMGGMFDDLSVVIGGMLDGRSAQSLSVVNKATFVGSRQYWESQILQLSQRFAPPSISISPLAMERSAPRVQTPLLVQVKALQASGMPDHIIGEALGRRLRELIPPEKAKLALTTPAPREPEPRPEELESIPYLLEAMAHVGAFPARQWLKEGWDIDA